MERFVIEERLPCALPELHRERVRRELEDPSQPAYLGVPMKVVPLLDGYRLSTPVGVFFVDRLDTIERLSAEGLTPVDCDPDRLDELEQLHAAGLLTTERASCRRYTLYDQGERYRHHYEVDRSTWFCMSPVTLEIDLTNRCNQSCVHCCRSSSPWVDVTPEMTFREQLIVIDQAADIGVDEVCFLGGEPTLHPHLLELAYVVRKRGIDNLMLATNALTVKDRWIEPLSVLFSSIQVSLHGASARTHEAIVGRAGAFDRVLANIRRMTACGANLSLACTVLEPRLEELERMRILAADLGVRELRFIPLSEEGRGQCLPPLSWQAYREVGDYISSLDDGAGDDFRVTSGGFPTAGGTASDALFFGCSAGLTKLHLDARGVATGCSLLGAGGVDARDTPLLEVWHCRKLRTMRSRVTCDCPYAVRCAGGCLSVPFNAMSRKEIEDGQDEEEHEDRRDQGAPGAGEEARRGGRAADAGVSWH
jgi:MoaA/NifB/PqqE/SkfB family radical SAM enzyme